MEANNLIKSVPDGKAPLSPHQDCFTTAPISEATVTLPHPRPHHDKSSVDRKLVGGAGAVAGDQEQSNGDQIKIYSASGCDMNMKEKGCPFDIICEFLQVVIQKKYPEAIELSRKILIYEPENQVVKEFQELLSLERFAQDEGESQDSSEPEPDSSSDEESSSSSSSSDDDESDEEEEEDSTYSTGSENEEQEVAPDLQLQGRLHLHDGDGDAEMQPDFDISANLESYIINQMNAVGMKALSKFFHVDMDSSGEEDDSTTTTTTSESESGESSSDQDENEQNQDHDDSGFSNGGSSP